MSKLVTLPEESYYRDAFAKFWAPDGVVDVGRAMMWLSQLAYEDDQDKITKIGRLWNLEPVTYFREPAESILQSHLPDTRGVIAKTTNDVTIICFSGTDPL